MNSINAIKFIWEGTSTLSLAKTGSPSIVSLEYSYNGIDWIAWVFSALTINSGDTLYIRGYNPNGFSSFTDNCYSFVIEGDDVSCLGNIMSLIDYKNSPNAIPCDYCFSKLFSGCTSLANAPELPATTLTEGCYFGMFDGCSSLTTVPELPARGLAYSCYHRMFSGCTSLTSAPELPTNDFIYIYYVGNLMVGLC